MEPSDALKDYARDKLIRVEKYLDAPLDASVVLTVEKFRHIADVTVSSDGLKINAQEQTEDMYSAIDMVVDKIERQLKRHRQKMKSKKASKKGRARENDNALSPAPQAAETDEGPQLVRTQQMFAKPMDADEALMQLDLSEDSFLVFTNATTEKINVVYKRDDGHYGLIEPLTE
jgi:putative sigma-54 modulation protein